jgi:hypothetical protein
MEVSVVKVKAIAFAVTFLLSCISCTSLRPISGSPEVIQQEILSGRLLHTGDRVRLVTSDGSEHKLRIVKVDIEQGIIVGDGDQVSIVQIAAAQKRELSWIKTGALIVGLAFVATGDKPDDGYVECRYGDPGTTVGPFGVLVC